VKGFRFRFQGVVFRVWGLGLRAYQRLRADAGGDLAGSLRGGRVQILAHLPAQNFFYTSVL